MNDRAARQPTDWTSDAMRKRIVGRYRAEARFRFAGLFAIFLSASFLAFLLGSMLFTGLGGFTRTELRLPINFPALGMQVDPASLNGTTAKSTLINADIEGAVQRAATAAFGADGPKLLNDNAWRTVLNDVLADPSLLTKNTVMSVPVSTALDTASNGESDAAGIAKYKSLTEKGVVTNALSLHFFTESDATEPSEVGIWGAFKGSLLTMLVTLLLSFPVGVLSAVYLEEYAPKNRWTDLIEVSINNLAAVPSIIFGLLGLAVFLGFFGMPRSAPLVGGMTLALMTMPVIVIAGRNAIKAVPPSIRDAALGVGASPVQVVFHHVLPLALPGILTGTIIGMARALGETAPLLMIGMRAFISTPPDGITSPSSVLPVQIYLWSDEISRGFVEKTSAAIIVLLVFLLAMNGIAIYLRNRFEQRW